LRGIDLRCVRNAGTKQLVLHHAAAATVQQARAFDSLGAERVE
jgi:hypothetical protein